MYTFVILYMQYLMLKWTIFRYTPSKFLRSFLHFSYIFQQFKKTDLLPAAKEMKVEGQEETQERI